MAYVVRGEVKGKRPWGLGMIVEFFWAFINTIMGFIATMFSMDASNTYGLRKPKSEGRRGGLGGGGSGGWGPSGGPGRGPAPGKRGLSGLDNVKGIDHTAPSPCGSCCGG